MCACVHIVVCLWRSGHSLQDVVGYFHHVCPRDKPDHQAWPQVLLHSSLTTKSKILRRTFNKTSLLQREIKSSFLCSGCIGWDKSKQAICTVHKLFPNDNGCIFHLEWYFDSIKWVLRIKVVFKGNQRLDSQKWRKQS